jgi:tetratricopeptide (TPR) repeat protein
MNIYQYLIRVIVTTLSHRNMYAHIHRGTFFAEQALHLLDRSGRSGMELSLKLYSATLTAVARSGRYKEAQELLQQLEQAGLQADLIVYTAAVSACDEQGAWRAALDILQQAKTAGKYCTIYVFTYFYLWLCLYCERGIGGLVLSKMMSTGVITCHTRVVMCTHNDSSTCCSLWYYSPAALCVQRA